MATRILVGDALERLAELPDASVHCVMTSPPYWGLRDYGIEGGIGLEATMTEHVTRLVEVFRELRRVLRPDGTAWVNYGDACCSVGHRKSNAGYGSTGLSGGNPQVHTPMGAGAMEKDASDVGLKHKDLLGLPWRLAFALQADGWWLRRDNVWAKPNPTPESVTDRPTSSHEFVFLLTRSGATTFWTHRDHAGCRTPPEPDYRWVHKATGEEVAAEPPGWRESNEWRRINLWSGHDYFYDPVAVRQPGSPNTHARRKDGEKRPAKGSDPNDNRPGTWRDLRTVEEQAAIGSNLRDVWWIPPGQFREAHFATFPERLAEIPIRSGTSAAGCCPDCGAPWTRLVRPAKPTELEGQYAKPYEGTTGKNFEGSRAENARDVKSRIVAAAREGRLTLATTGWTPSCRHEGKAVPCTVLDPFAGAGTVGLVAGRLNRDSILVEISPKYADMARRRILGATGLLNPVGVS